MPVLPVRHLSLHCHTSQICEVPVALQASAGVLARGALHLQFVLSAELGALRLPRVVAEAGFADGLWQHTCFEAFVGVAGSLRYHEFNLSPSGQWAAYAFADYRQRDEGWLPAGVPSFSVQQEGNVLTLDAQVPAALLPTQLPASGAGFDVSLTAVIECADGSLSYWALAHAGERPDFNKRASFTLRLETP